jgi:hypothetical protein
MARIQFISHNKECVNINILQLTLYQNALYQYYFFSLVLQTVFRNSQKPFYSDRSHSCCHTNISIRTLYTVSDIFVSPNVYKHKVTHKIINYLNFVQTLQLSCDTNLHIYMSKKQRNTSSTECKKNIVSILQLNFCKRNVYLCKHGVEHVLCNLSK